MTLSLRARTIGLLERYQLRTQKRLSQNFLIDERVLQQLVASLEIHSSDSMLEVGPGPGFLTEILAENSSHLIAVEIDPDFCAVLEERFKDNPKTKIVCQSILSFDPKKHFKKTLYKAVGNLPYHLSGSILRWFLDHRQCFSDLYFMLQKEVGERITAKPGSKNYGVLSILCQYFTDPKILFEIQQQAFLPPPKVDSVFLKLTPKKQDDALAPVFVDVVKRAFTHRRKTIINNFKPWDIFPTEKWQEILTGAGISLSERSENLSVEVFIQLAALVTAYGGSDSLTINSP